MNVRRATVSDNETIKGIYANESIWPFVTDDGALDIHAINFTDALNNQGVYFIIVEDNNKPVGIFLFNPWNTACYEMHSAVLPEYRGEGSMEAARLVGMWMFSNTLCQKLVTQIPVTNYAARALARVCGMVKIGNNDRSFLKNGKLIDQHIYGICKEDV